ncbi:hypothetical protein B7494_g4555 [Chlorociboria aeruginascens]|nr:hypothetical protein B7494_g4555 [Chlorociboria aeruginascens]
MIFKTWTGESENAKEIPEVPCQKAQPVTSAHFLVLDPITTGPAPTQELFASVRSGSVPRPPSQGKRCYGQLGGTCAWVAGCGAELCVLRCCAELFLL